MNDIAISTGLILFLGKPVAAQGAAAFVPWNS
jgi:hypothetical protein